MKLVPPLQRPLFLLEVHHQWILLLAGKGAAQACSTGCRYITPAVNGTQNSFSRRRVSSTNGQSTFVTYASHCVCWRKQICPFWPSFQVWSGVCTTLTHQLGQLPRVIYGAKLPHDPSTTFPDRWVFSEQQSGSTNADVTSRGDDSCQEGDLEIYCFAQRREYEFRFQRWNRWLHHYGRRPEPAITP